MAKSEMISFRGNTQQVEALSSKLGYSKTEVLEHALNAYDVLRKRTARELKGFFNENEVKALVDNQNGTMLTPEYQHSVELFITGVQDANEYEGLFEKWSIDGEVLIEKISKMTTAQVYFWQEEVDRFWNVPSAFGAPTPDLDKFLTEYADSSIPEQPKFKLDFSQAQFPTEEEMDAALCYELDGLIIKTVMGGEGLPMAVIDILGRQVVPLQGPATQDRVEHIKQYISPTTEILWVRGENPFI